MDVIKGYEAHVYSTETDYGDMVLVLVFHQEAEVFNMLGDRKKRLINPFDAVRKVVISVGKSGYEVRANAEGIERMINLGLAAGVGLDHIIKQLDGIVSSDKNTISLYVVLLLRTFLRDTKGTNELYGFKSMVDDNLNRREE